MIALEGITKHVKLSAILLNLNINQRFAYVCKLSERKFRKETFRKFAGVSELMFRNSRVDTASVTL